MRTHGTTTDHTARLPLLRAAALLATASAAVRYLHDLAAEPWARIGTEDPYGWLVATPAEDVVAALLRVVALAACWWVLGSLVLAVAARAVGWRPAVRFVDRLAPGTVRRLADGITGGALLLAALLGPVVPAAAAPSDDGVARAEVVPPGAVPPPQAGQLSTEPAPPALPPTSEPRDGGEGRRLEVGAGDHLWGLARAELARHLGVPVHQLTAGRVAPYWRAVVAANRDRLRSGDPDLVHPGETVVLPPITR